MQGVYGILAHDREFGIGKDGKLPWPRNDNDMKWFRDCTRNGVIVMGRKTWDSLGNTSLPGRINIVMSGGEVYGTPDGTHDGDISDLLFSLVKQYPDRKIWIIGGANIYEQGLPFCESIFVTQFDSVHDCDTHVEIKKYLNGYVELVKKDSDNVKFSIWRKIY